MEFRIADTFTASLGRLGGDEQKLVKTTAFDLQLNPAIPGHQFHKLDRARDPHFWSVRVSSDIRLIVHRTDASLLVCYVDHHDDAYRWAERRNVETHPKTGAAQLVEIRGVVREVETFSPAPGRSSVDSSTRRRRSRFLSFDFWRHWRAIGRTASSLRATSGSGSSSRHSLGFRPESTFAAGPVR